jgi:hypothetical protein
VTITGQLDLGWATRAEQLDLAFNVAEARDSQGRWTRFGGVGAAVKIMEKEREGFSVSPRTGESPQHGYMVALDGHTHRYPAAILDDPAKLHKAIDDMLMSEKSSFRGGDMYLGGWVEDGKLWLDPSQNVPDLATATKLGKERDQVGIFDVDTFNTVGTGGSGGGRIIDHANAQEGARGHPAGLLGSAGGRTPGGGGEDRGRYPLGIVAQLDLAYNPLERRGAGGKWGAGASLKAHDTAAATARRDALAHDAYRARIAALDGRLKAANAEIAERQRHLHELNYGKDTPYTPPPPPPPETVAPAAPEDADDPVSKQLDADAATGITEAQSPKDRARKAGLNPAYFGNSAATSVVTFGNGHQWIRKRGLGEDEMHREVLVSKISDVLGAGAPQVTLRPDGTTAAWKTPSQEMWEPVVPNAVPAVAWLGDQNDPGNKHDLYDMVSSQAGVKMGILDTITDNGDRHEGNWMVQTDPVTGRERPVPIDHGRAVMGDKRQAEYGGTGPFGQHLFQEGQESEQLAAIPADAWASWIHRIDLLSPQFRTYGMSPQLENVQGALEIIMKMSNRARKQMPHATGQPFTPDAPELWTGPTE